MPPVPPPIESEEVLAESMPVPVLDEMRVQELTAKIEVDADDLDSKLALANVYYEAQQFEQAIPWFEQVLVLRSEDVDTSTKLGVCFYFVGFPERAIEQFLLSLEIAPNDPQTLLNLGIVRAFGLQDLDGAVVAWERVIEVDPGGSQARAAREALSQFQAVHQLSDSEEQESEVNEP